MTRLSFVIGTSGDRVQVLDELVLPAIFEQQVELEEIGGAEVVVAGGYRGRHGSRLRVVAAPTGGEFFYKPFQAGVEAALGEWIVDLDDDMLLGEGWARAVTALRLDRPAIYGFSFLNPDGSDYGLYFNAVDNCLNGRAGRGSYFSSSLAPAELYRDTRYPTYQSGDRAHALRLWEREPDVPRVGLTDVRMTHLGFSESHPGLAPRTATAERDATGELIAFLGENNIAWVPFADRYLDGVPQAERAEIWKAAREAVGDPELRAKRHWLL